VAKEKRMKLGLQLHPERGIDAVFEEACQADAQGYDSIWLFDHLMDWHSHHTPDGPYDSFTLMAALGGATKRVRLSWATLNLSFRYPQVLAKMLTTLDQATHGRVICCLGSGWFEEECEAYSIPLRQDHDERAEYAREVVHLFKQLWTHPAPERTTFEGKYVRVRNLPFNPEPYQKPHPPIWMGGDSDVSLSIVKDLADGWLMLRSGNPQTLSKVLGASDWPKRPVVVAKGARIFVAESRQEAIDEAAVSYAATANASVARAEQPGHPSVPQSAEVQQFIAREIVGTPDECMDRVAEIASWGINYLRLNFDNLTQQERVARLILPLFAA
jgi:alkanesulfonate monooxygenase SsuD/methylene tetrahydromethanopterin reductase-like flavin-dependent oxidoreductase (luciferase family)